jgi:hypothetical protein
MVDIVVTRKYKGEKYGINQNPYSFTGPALPTVSVTEYPEPYIFYFKDTSTPVIDKYDTLFAKTYGRHPRFILVVYQDAMESDLSTNEIVKYIEPTLTIVDDVITTVTYQLGGLGEMSGYIIINK